MAGSALPFSRTAQLDEPKDRDQFRFAVPRSEDLEFFGNAEWQAIYADGVERLLAMGGEPVEIEFAPFRTVSELLYGGALVAERVVGIRSFVVKHSDAMHPVTREIMEGGAQHLGVDVFDALHHLHELRVQTLKTWEVADFLFIPHRRDNLHYCGGGCRSDPTECQPWHLYELREPSRSLRNRCSHRL